MQNKIGMQSEKENLVLINAKKSNYTFKKWIGQRKKSQEKLENILRQMRMKTQHSKPNDAARAVLEANW